MGAIISCLASPPAASSGPPNATFSQQYTCSNSTMQQQHVEMKILVHKGPERRDSPILDSTPSLHTEPGVQAEQTCQNAYDISTATSPVTPTRSPRANSPRYKRSDDSPFQTRPKTQDVHNPVENWPGSPWYPRNFRDNDYTVSDHGAAGGRRQKW